MSISYVDAVSATHTLEEESGDTGGTTRPVHGLPDDVKTWLSNTTTAVQALAAIISAAQLAVTDATTHTKLDTLHTDLATTLAAYVDGLEALLGTTNTGLATLHTDIATTIAGYVDGLEGLITSSNTKLDTLHTDIGTTIHADLATTLAGKLDTLHTDLATTLAGYVDGLEALITSSNTKLDTLHTDLGTLHTDLATTLGGKLDALAAPASGFYGSKTSSTVGTQVALAGSQAILNGVWIKAKAANTGVVYVCVSGGTSTNGLPLNAGEAIFCSIANLATVFIDVTVSGEGVNYWGS